MAQEKHPHQLSAREESRVRDRITREPNLTQPRVRLAQHCWRSGALPEAVRWIDSCLAIAPDKLNFYRIRANICIDMNNSAAAVATATRACVIVPDSIQARQLLARMLLADLQPGKAQDTLNAMLEMEPNERQQQQIKSLQLHTRNMRRQAQNRPLKWLKRKLKKRIANVTSGA